MFATICFADSIFNLVLRLKLRQDKTVSIKAPGWFVLHHLHRGVSQSWRKVGAKEKYSLVDMIKYTQKWMTGDLTKKNPNPPKKSQISIILNKCHYTHHVSFRKAVIRVSESSWAAIATRGTDHVRAHSFLNLFWFFIKLASPLAL